MRKLAYVLMIVLMTVVVWAQFVSVVEPTEVSIRQNETATLLLSLRHSSATTEFFELFSPDVIWDIRPDRPLRVEPNREFTAKLYIRPLKVAPGTYGIPLSIKIAGTKSQAKHNVVLELLPTVDNGESYLPAFKGNASMARKTDPRNEAKVYLDVVNLNRRNLSDINIKIRSDLVNKDYVTQLEPLERKKFEFSIRLDPNTEPRKDVVRISIIKLEGDKTYQYDVPPVDFEVIKYGGVDTEIEEDTEWFRKTFGVTVLNNGNTHQEDVFAFPSNIVQTFFTDSMPSAERIGGFLTWNVKLGPGQSTKIRIVRNYRGLVGALALAALAAGLYYAFRTPLVMKKSVRVLRRQDDGITDVKVNLLVKNRSAKELTDVEVMDRIPQMGELVREFDVGTIEPVKVVRHEHKGTIVKWSIDALEPNEERVLAYKITTKFGVLGGLTLPVAEARVALKSGRVRHAVSSVAKVER